MTCASAVQAAASLAAPPANASALYLDVYVVPACFDDLRSLFAPLIAVASTNLSSTQLTVTPFTWAPMGWAGAAPAVALAARYAACAQAQLRTAYARVQFFKCFFVDSSLSSAATEVQVTLAGSTCATPSLLLESVLPLKNCVTPVQGLVSNDTGALMEAARSSAVNFLTAAFTGDTLSDQPMYTFLQGQSVCLASWDAGSLAQEACLAQLRPPPALVNSSGRAGGWPAPSVVPGPPVDESLDCYIVDTGYAASCSTPLAAYRTTVGLLEFVPIVSLFLLSMSLVSLMCMMILRRRQRRHRRQRTLHRQAAERRLDEVLELLSQLSAFERAANTSEAGVRHVSDVETALAALPKRSVPVPVSEGAGAGAALAAESCCICLESMAGATYYELPRCRHVFHSECLKQWLVSGKYDCPVCRAFIVRPTSVSPFASSGAAFAAQLAVPGEAQGAVQVVQAVPVEAAPSRAAVAPAGAQPVEVQQQPHHGAGSGVTAVAQV